MAGGSNMRWIWLIVVIALAGGEMSSGESTSADSNERPAGDAARGREAG